MRLNFCSRCGHPFEPADHSQPVPRQVCLHCGEVFYNGPRVIVALFAYRGDQLLMQKRNQEPARGYWTVPSGFVESFETPEQAIIRETLEETGVLVGAEELHPYFNVGFATINEIHIVFRAELRESAVPVAGPESAEVAFLSQPDIQARPLAFRDVVGDYTAFFFEHLRERRFPIMSVRVTGKPDSPVMESTAYALEQGGIREFEGYSRVPKI